MRFDTYAMVDWSGGNDTGPKPRKDAIWAAVVRRGVADAPVYLRNRLAAENWLGNLIEAELTAGRRLCLGFDFPFGYPERFSKHLTGTSDPLALWDWLEARIEDSPSANNRFDLAGEINQMCPGEGPFWFNGLKRDVDGLPRTQAHYGGHGFAEKRQAENRAKGAFTCWQMGGPGAVGSQVLMGLPVLARLRRRFAKDVRVWPFETLDTPVAFVEVWPSLLAKEVAGAMAPGEIKDAAQVRILARAMAELNADELGAMLAVEATIEGWIFGLGHEDILRRAAGAPRPLQDDCFALPPGVHWTPVPEALSRLEGALTPVVGQAACPVNEALGRVLARDHLALRANPPAANAAVDGYGFAHGAIGDPALGLPLVLGRAAAGAPFMGEVPAGSAVRILTGALLPAGVDTVVLQEDCDLREGRVIFAKPPKPGANSRRAGEDVDSGEVALPKGHLMRPQDLGLLAALGVSSVDILRPLRVGVMSTGDELVDPGDPADPSRTYDANRPMLLGLARAWGYEVHDLGAVRDDRNTLRRALSKASSQVDVIFASGGASAGEEDHVSALLQDAGAMSEWRIAMKPGRPLVLAQWQGVPVFGLPGNPVAAFVCALIFARPALSKLAGAGWHDALGVQLPAAFSKKRKPGRREYLRARLAKDGRVEVFASEGSGRISGLSWADGLVQLEDDGQDVAEGDLVTYLPFSSFGI